MEKPFVLGLDLDGVCADFYGKMREIAAEWYGRPICELPVNVSYKLPQWGVSSDDEYKRLHQFAVTQRSLFKDIRPIKGAPEAIRRLDNDGIRIRIITYRLFIPNFHQVAVSQTVHWLDNHGIPYWDLCFMRDKELVDAAVYIEDSPKSIEALENCNDGRRVIAFTNSTNHHVNATLRADDWVQAERLVRNLHHHWLRSGDAQLQLTQ